jgi:hypothetical protein
MRARQLLAAAALLMQAGLILAACDSPDFTAIKQRCAAVPDRAACEQQGYDAYYAVQRDKLKRVGGP